MLNTYRKGAFALAAALTFAAGTAQAEEHVVLIVDGSYFPSVVFAAAGDQLTFQNESSGSHTVTGADEAWTSGPISAAGSFSIELTEEIPASFAGTEIGGEAPTGEIVFQ